MKAPFSRFKVFGNSMLPTLKPGQDVLVFNWAYIFSRPKKGDLVVVEHGGREIIKRVQISSGPASPRLRRASRGTFVIGDNKNCSTDSRNFGAIDKSKILGKVIFII
ncbi:S26 family signal peptidase [Candidatus Daviesbacteria bacterium]|nr:S26 family signal peptidase [Candidatus Daviesbacteria bacterium]